ncbi:MAG: hypothetical protein IKR11_00585 [Solobacterium sp.]|nr:hypothetical protein [Solobacterium sp.]
MKLDVHGIRFRLWLAFFLLASGITILLGLLQTGLIRPYYRNSKIQSIRTVADSIQEDLVGTNTTTDSFSIALRRAVDNDVCVAIYNEKGKNIYDADSLGAGCIFHLPADASEGGFSFAEVYETLNEGNKEYSANMTNVRTGQEMIVYGRKIEEELSNYYLFVNSPLEPVDSIVSIFTRQYAFYTGIAIILASFLALYISSRLTKPIVEMNKEALKLAAADYSASFSGGEFTETRELADTLNTANDKLSKIDELRRDLIANVSHDIRTPLTDIRAYAEMILDISGDDPKKRAKHLDVIIRETDYMNRLVNDMSELSKMQSGNYELSRENIDISELVEEIAELDAPLLEAGKINLVMDVGESLTAYADEIKISQVIANYFSNAIKHSPEGGTITVKAWLKEDEETVRVEVSDEGEGITDEELPYIWDRYQKSSKSFSRNQTSTGLGLAIVKAILDSHGALYGVETEEGKGSTFWFELRETHEA